MAQDVNTGDGTEQSREELNRLGRIIIGLVLVALASSACGVMAGGACRSLGVALLTGIVGLAFGGFLGFIFGIPKTMTSAAQKEAGPQSPGSMRSNTNLEEVSDWLTKIIVGVGLTQLHQLSDRVRQVEHFIRGYFPEGPTPLVATLILIFGIVIGFIWVYLQTRTILTKVLDDFGRVRIRNLQNALTEIASALPQGRKELAPAADALRNAADNSPNNSVLKSAAVRALVAAGRTDEAGSMVGNARTVEERINQMLVALYRPGGYRDALSVSAVLSGSEAARANPDYWVYTACAFGQQHRALLDGGDKTALCSARDNALDAARRALELDPGEKERLRNFLYPNPSMFPEDDDLADFADDPDFQALLGPPGVG